MSGRRVGGAEIRDRLDELAAIVTDRQFERHPELALKYGASGRARCIEDARFHLAFLATAVETGIDAIFIDYIAWAKIVLTTRKVPADDLEAGLHIIADVVGSRLKRGLADDPIRLLGVAAARVAAMPLTVPSFLDARSDSATLARAYLDALLAMNAAKAMRVIADALSRGVPPLTICAEVLEPVQHEVGRLWQLNEISVAVEHFCSAVTQKALDQIGAARRVETDPSRKRVVALCAPGELHDIGLRSITESLALDGWHIVHLGADVPAVAAAQMCVDWKAEVVLISATLPTHIAAVRTVVEQVRSHATLRATRVFVGGRAFAGEAGLWKFTGADGSAANASQLLDALR